MNTKLMERRLKRQLLRVFKEAFAKYSDKDWESIFSKELSYIEDESIKTIVVAALEWFADEMDKTGPASSTGKYHPASDSGDGGLIRHTKTVVKYATSLLEMEREGSAVLEHKDEIVAAAILHDIAKFDKGTEEQAKIDAQWEENPDKYFRKPILIDYTVKKYKVPVGGFESYVSKSGKPSFVKSRGWWKCDWENPPVDGWESVVDENGEECTKCEKPPVYCRNDHPKKMAEFVRTMEKLFPLPNYGQVIENIADLVETHEGRFNTGWGLGSGKKALWKNPEDISSEILQKAAKVVHTADYVAARSYGDYAFDDNGDIVEGPEEVKKAQRKSFVDDNKEEIEDLKSEIEDLQIIVDAGEATEREIKSLERNKKLLKKLLGESKKTVREGLGRGFGQGLFDKDSVLTSKRKDDIEFGKFSKRFQDLIDDEEGWSEPPVCSECGWNPTYSDDIKSVDEWCEELNVPYCEAFEPTDRKICEDCFQELLKK